MTERSLSLLFLMIAQVVSLHHHIISFVHLFIKIHRAIIAVKQTRKIKRFGELKKENLLINAIK